MDNSDYQQYKIAKTISEQIEYLNKNKRVQFNCMDKDTAKDKLLEYNYIHIITPFKHKFAKLNENKEVEKVNGNHVYERDVDFNEYYSLFRDEKKDIQQSFLIYLILKFTLRQSQHIIY